MESIWGASWGATLLGAIGKFNIELITFWCMLSFGPVLTCLCYESTLAARFAVSRIAICSEHLAGVT